MRAAVRSGQLRRQALSEPLATVDERCYTKRVGTEAQLPPIDEITRCAEGCAAWLQRRGTLRPCRHRLAREHACTPGCALRGVDDAAVNSCRDVNAVYFLLNWLWCDVLGAHVHRPAAFRARANAERSEHDPAPLEYAKLHYGNDEVDVAAAVRDVTAAIERLIPHLEGIAERQASRAVLVNDDRGANLRAAGEAWTAWGREVERLVLPTLGVGGFQLPVPHHARRLEAPATRNGTGPSRCRAPRPGDR